MITCKDCYLYDGCTAGHLHCYDEDGIKSNCKSYKNKNNYVEVIRCKDCKWWKDKRCSNVNGAYGNSIFNPDWFCRSGQRKD